MAPSGEKNNGLTRESLATTKLLLSNCLGTINGLSLEFLTDEILAKPSFSFVRALVKLVVDALSFAKSLFHNKDLDPNARLSRTEKINFLIKILSCVASITGERVDIFVSPSEVICGQNVCLTHTFLRALVKASHSPPEISNQAAIKVIQKDQSIFYKQCVRARKTIIRVQAIVRGRIVRKRRGTRHKRSNSHNHDCGINNQKVKTKADTTFTATSWMKYHQSGSHKQCHLVNKSLAPMEQVNTPNECMSKIPIHQKTSQALAETDLTGNKSYGVKTKLVWGEDAYGIAQGAEFSPAPCPSILSRAKTSPHTCSDRKRRAKSDVVPAYNCWGSAAQFSSKSDVDDSMKSDLLQAHRSFENEMKCFKHARERERDRQLTNLHRRLAEKERDSSSTQSSLNTPQKKFLQRKLSPPSSAPASIILSKQGRKKLIDAKITTVTHLTNSRVNIQNDLEESSHPTVLELTRYEKHISHLYSKSTRADNERKSAQDKDKLSLHFELQQKMKKLKKLETRLETRMKKTKEKEDALEEREQKVLKLSQRLRTQKKKKLVCAKCCHSRNNDTEHGSHAPPGELPDLPLARNKHSKCAHMTKMPKASHCKNCFSSTGLERKRLSLNKREHLLRSRERHVSILIMNFLYSKSKEQASTDGNIIQKPKSTSHDTNIQPTLSLKNKTKNSDKSSADYRLEYDPSIHDGSRVSRISRNKVFVEDGKRKNHASPQIEKHNSSQLHHAFEEKENVTNHDRNSYRIKVAHRRNAFVRTTGQCGCISKKGERETEGRVSLKEKARSISNHCSCQNSSNKTLSSSFHETEKSAHRKESFHDINANIANRAFYCRRQADKKLKRKKKDTAKKTVINKHVATGTRSSRATSGRKESQQDSNNRERKNISEIICNYNTSETSSHCRVTNAPEATSPGNPKMTSKQQNKSTVRTKKKLKEASQYLGFSFSFDEKVGEENGIYLPHRHCKDISKRKRSNISNYDSHRKIINKSDSSTSSQRKLSSHCAWMVTFDTQMESALGRFKELA